MKTAVISMDIEDWYHLDYFDRQKCNEAVSMLDGLSNYRELLDRHDIKTTFFVLGELVNGPIRKELLELKRTGHEIASHGWSHQRPLAVTKQAFIEDLKRSKGEIEDVIGERVEGYRAPCFSIDRDLLEVVRETGYYYDSSRILCDAHPLYGTINIDGFNQINSEIFRFGDFFEFQVSTLSTFGRNIPVSGGGYLRIFPWHCLMKGLLNNYLKKHDFYVLYIHPFELSKVQPTIFPANTKWTTRRRFSTGRRNVGAKLDKLITLLKDNGFSFTTFSRLRRKYLQSNTKNEC